MPLYNFTDQQIALIQEVLDKVKNTRATIPSRPPMERSFTEGEDHQAPETYVAYPQTSAGIPKLLETGAYDEPGKAKCDIYQIIENSVTGDPELRQVPGFFHWVYNISVEDISQKWLPVTRTKFGKWLALTSGSEFQLVGGCLAEQHPGRSRCPGTGNHFLIYLGEWDSSQNCWVYYEGATYWAIDFRYDVPYPAAGAQGLFTPRESDDYGIIWETVALDCSSPGDCSD